MTKNYKFNIGDEVYFFDPDYEKGEEIFQSKIKGVQEVANSKLDKPSYTYSIEFERVLNNIEEEFLFKDKPLKQLEANIIARTNNRIYFLRVDIKKLSDEITAKKELLALEKQKIENLK